MDAYSSGEELLVKARKPYTITKQRERWTEEEHNRFLEALKLYGRTWQRIEEYIGTKTAVQIRSHAQKFFSKLEKEALVKGVPIEQAIDIEIPPPRPKRKPANPYPRKTGVICSPNTQAREKDGKQIPSCSHSVKQAIDLDNELIPEKHVCDDGENNPKGTCGGDKCSEVARKLSNLKEFVPLKKTLVNEKRSESQAADRPKVNQKPDSVEISQNNSNDEMHAAKSFPRHAPVQILDGSQGSCSQGFSSDVSYQHPKSQMEIAGHPALSGNPAVSGAIESQNSTIRSSNQQIYPGFHPSCNPLPNNQGDYYYSFLQMSSTFSSLILSALLQNPAAHAAANFATSLWPTTNVKNSAHSSAGNNGDLAPAPSMAAIAAATVAAATAWWASHGLLQIAAPFPCGLSFPPASITAPFANVGQTSAATDAKEEYNFQIPGSQVQQLSEALRPQHSASKSSETSSSNSRNSGESMDIGAVAANTEEAPSISEQKDTSKVKNKQVDRSSCGSNTPSGSEAETNALGKNDKGNDESKERDENNNASELNGHRIRIVGNTYDSWKEVSEEGRLAFRALFSKGRLPQSFSPPHNFTSKEQEMKDGVENSDPSNEEASRFDLNSCPCKSLSSDKGPESHSDVNSEDGALTTTFLETKLTRTGFKPYKRCSVESRMMNSSNQEQGNCSKRLRLEGEASI